MQDQIFFKELDLKKGSFIVFDKGYADYEQYQQWTLDEIYFVTRQRAMPDIQVFESLTYQTTRTMPS